MSSGTHRHAHGPEPGHRHHHHHASGPRGAQDYDRAFKLGIGMNSLFLVVEAGAGLAVGSMALISDAAHNLGDVLALGLAWGAFALARRRPTARHTYGLKRATILASLVSAVVLCVTLGAVVWEALARLAAPPALNGTAMMVVAAIGVGVNAVTAAMFAHGRHSDLNLRGAYLHMAADAAVSLAVVVAGGLILYTGWGWLDPALALAVSVTILISGFGLLRESLGLAMDAVPAHVDIDGVREYLSGLPGVEDVHDLHIWAMSTTETALTAHLVTDWAGTADERLHAVAQHLRTTFGINHPTIQLEHDLSDEGCVYPDRLVRPSGRS